MKLLYTLCLLVSYGISYGQYNHEVVEKFAKDVCNCLESSNAKALADHAEATTTNCIQTGIDLNMDALLEVYGSGFLDGGELAHHVSSDLTQELNKECKVYKGGQKKENISEQGYNHQQAALVVHLTNEACQCSEDKLRANPNQSFQDVLESCMQQSVMGNTEQLSEAFGDAILTDENLAYNIGVDIGRKLVMECDVFVSGIVTPIENAVKTQSEIGTISGSKNGDYMSVSLINSSGVENTFYVASAFEGGKEFLSQINDLQKSESPVTIYYVEEELFFKTENADKSVFRIETVKY